MEERRIDRERLIKREMGGQTSFILAPHIELNYLNNNHNNQVQRTYYVSSTITMTLQISINLSNCDVR